MTGLLFANVNATWTYGVPFALLAAGAGLWFALGFDRSPPVLETVPPDRSWAKSPLDRVDVGLREGRLLPVIRGLRERISGALAERYQISARAPPMMWNSPGRLAAPAVALLKADRELRTAEVYAARVERPEGEDFVTRWRAPAWRETARARIQSALSLALPALGLGTEATA